MNLGEYSLLNESKILQRDNTVRKYHHTSKSASRATDSITCDEDGKNVVTTQIITVH